MSQIERAERQAREAQTKLEQASVQFNRMMAIVQTLVRICSIPVAPWPESPELREALESYRVAKSGKKADEAYAAVLECVKKSLSVKKSNGVVPKLEVPNTEFEQTMADVAQGIGLNVQVSEETGLTSLSLVAPQKQPKLVPANIADKKICTVHKLIMPKGMPCPKCAQEGDALKQQEALAVQPAVPARPCACGHAEHVGAIGRCKTVGCACEGFTIPVKTEPAAVRT